MKKNIIINNSKTFHYEIIESVICSLKQILKLNNFNLDDYNIFFNMKINDLSFKNYLKNIFPFIKINFNLNKIKKNYFIEISNYDKDYDKMIHNSNSFFYICHNISDRLLKLNNTIFLTPLCNKKYLQCIRLPYVKHKKIKTIVPIFLIQGTIKENRRDYKLLLLLLNKQFDYDYRIKILGRGNLPEYLKKYKNKIIFKNNLNFIDYHKELLDIHCLLTLTSKEKTPGYYKTKLTSSINYIKGYNLNCIIDNKLQNIYNLKNCKTYKSNNEFINKFKRSINEFYNK